MARNFFCEILLCSLLCGVATAQSAPAQTPAVAENNRQEQGNLTIGPADLLDILVYDVPELVLKVRVSDTGMITLPLVGDFKVGNRTVKQAQDELAQALIEKNLVLHPQVSILITEFATQGITVVGEVLQPGIYPLLGPHRLFDAIAAAGGLSAKAARNVKITHKGNPDDANEIELPQDMVSSSSTNLPLQPGDTIVVAKAGVVYVVGEVNKPGGFLMENNTRMSVLQSLALAQGSTKMANMKGAMIVRRGPSGMQEIPVQLNKIMEAKASDRLLMNDDIVFIPSSKAKSFGKRAADAAVGSAVAAVIYMAR
jgi:polysaccharide biosynthesis/export protein